MKAPHAQENNTLQFNAKGKRTNGAKSVQELLACKAFVFPRVGGLVRLLYHAPFRPPTFCRHYKHDSSVPDCTSHDEMRRMLYLVF